MKERETCINESEAGIERGGGHGKGKIEAQPLDLLIS